MGSKRVKSCIYKLDIKYFPTPLDFPFHSAHKNVKNRESAEKIADFYVYVKKHCVIKLSSADVSRVSV